MARSSEGKGGVLDQFHYKIKSTDRDGNVSTISKFADDPQEMLDYIYDLKVVGSRIDFIRVGAHQRAGKMWGAYEDKYIKEGDFARQLSQVLTTDAQVYLDYCNGMVGVMMLVDLLPNGTNISINFTVGTNMSMYGTSFHLKREIRLNKNFGKEVGELYNATSLGPLNVWSVRKIDW